MSHETKTTAKTTAPATGELIPQPHGGALRNGGTNRGGPGRPPWQIRASCRDDFDTLRVKLVTIAKSRKAKDADRIRAIDVLARYGLGEQLNKNDVERAINKTTEEIIEFFEGNREQAKTLMARIAPHWLEV